MARAKVVPFVLAFLLSFFAVLAANGDELTERLDQLRSASESVLGEVQKLQRAVLKAEAKVRQLSSEVRRFQSREEELTKDLDTLLLELGEIEGERRRASERVAVLRKRRVARLHVLDEMFFEAPVLVSLFSSDRMNTDDITLLTAHLEERDYAESETLLEAEEELGEKQFQHEELVKKQRTLHSAIRDQRLSLSHLLKVRRDEESKIKVKQRALKLELIKVQAETLKLETVLSSLRSAPEEEGASLHNGEGVKGDAPRARRLVLTLAAKGNEKKSQPSLLAGRLILPLRGTILQRYRRAAAEDPQRNGILLQPLDDGERRMLSVVAVTTGTVSFRGKVPFFGETVILEHARDEFSLYGGLERIFVKPNERVQGGQEIGRLARTGPLYLELRRGGGAINPEPLFAPDAS